MDSEHKAYYISNRENKEHLIAEIFLRNENRKGEVFSEIALDIYIKKEEKYGEFDVVSSGPKKSLKKYSEGEKRKALLAYIISKNPDFVIIDNILDNLDAASQIEITNNLIQLGDEISIVQIANRKSDVLSFIKNVYFLENNKWCLLTCIEEEISERHFVLNIPNAYKEYTAVSDTLVKFQNVNILYEGVPVVKDLCWEVRENEFWQMIGPNGAGKSTLLSLITGDNVKAYGQDITLFGVKKGSGESVWDIKKRVGYFSSEMKRGLDRRETVEKMILSGFYDTIGLYTQPNKIQIEIVVKWLHLLKMYTIRKENFLTLSLGQQRLIMIARAMVKQPPLLILDEPTVGLDDESVLIITELINKIALETNTTIIYVSHRKEEGLNPELLFELKPSAFGALGFEKKIR